MRTVIVLILGLIAAGPGHSAQIAVSEAVRSYVNIRAEPSTNSAVIGALHAGKRAPLINESGEWFAIELPDGVTGYVSRYWTTIVEPTATPSDRQIYADEASADEPAPGSEAVRDRSVLAVASKLHKEGSPQAAYEMLSKLEVEWGGDAGFDYLYGVAALDSGYAGEAVFALERVIRLLPGFVGARLDLARALFETGDRERAQEEFESLLEAEPPEDVRDVIVGYLDALSQPEPDTERPNNIFYAAASGGYDSNANGAADINNFLGFTLDPRSTETDTPFVEAQLGGLIATPLTPALNFLWRGDVKHRHNPDADFVDHSFFSTAAALGFSRGKNDFVTGVAAYWSALDSGFNERSLALDLGWVRPVRNSIAQLTLRAGPAEFQDAQKIRDIDRVLYTLTLQHPIQDGNGAFNWTLIGGRDRAEDRSSAYSNTRIGGRIGANWKAAANNLMFDVGYLKIPYNGNSDFFGIDRDDEQMTTTFSIELPNKPFKGWALVPNLRYVKNKSNVPIFDYDRIEAGISFRVAR